MRKSIVVVSLLIIAVVSFFIGIGFSEDAAIGIALNKNTVIMYAPDGRELKVDKDEIEEYKAVGWFENQSDVMKTLYAPDGREMTVYISEVEAHKAVGWFEDKADVTTEMQSADGQKIIVFNAQVPEYQQNGWTPTRKIDPTKPMIALTFDDGPNPSSTSRILDVLEQNDAAATFFILGDRAKNNTELLKRMQTIGCQIGNHSYSHPNLSKMSAEDVASEVNGTFDIINNATGDHTKILRPPYGAYTDSTFSPIGATLIMWSVDTLDWQSRNPDSIYDATMSTVQDGDIVLMHDIYESTADAAEKIIPALISSGYQLVTISEMSKYKNKPLDANIVYHSFK